MKSQSKIAIAVLLIAATVATAGLLRLYEGQIQEQQLDGSWTCADSKIREIVNRENELQVYWANTLDAGANVDLFASHAIVDGMVYDPNTWSVPDSFVRSLCESGRVCKTMGHQWRLYGIEWQEWKCGLCGVPLK